VQTTYAGYPECNASLTNNYYKALPAVVFGVLYNSQGQALLIETGIVPASTPVASGATVYVQVAFPGLSHGTYTASLFVESSAGTALSNTATCSLSV